MKIDETLKENLIADVKNILDIKLTDNDETALMRCFEITIGHHYASQFRQDNGTISYLKSEAEQQMEEMTKILGKTPALIEQGVNAMIHIIKNPELYPDIFLQRYEIKASTPLQDAIKELKKYQLAARKRGVKGDLVEIVETVISAYEITDEQIEESISNSFAKEYGIGVKGFFIAQRIIGAKAFRDGKISKL